jgi:hypothetical protein
VVLEYNGPAWEAFQKSQEERNANRGFPQAMIMQSSRLVSIDAAKAPELLQKYVDQRKYMIVRGVVRLGVGIWDLKSQTPGAYRLEPSISEIMPGTIHVPLPLSTVLADRSSHTAAANLQYTVTLSYGSRFEPWVLVE